MIAAGKRWPGVFGKREPMVFVLLNSTNGYALVHRGRYPELVSLTMDKKRGSTVMMPEEARALGHALLVIADDAERGPA